MNIESLNGFTINRKELGIYIKKKRNYKRLTRLDISTPYLSTKTIQRLENEPYSLPSIEGLIHIASKLEIDLVDMVISSQFKEYTSIKKNYRKILFEISREITDKNLLIKMLLELQAIKLPFTEQLIVKTLLAFLDVEITEFTNFIEEKYLKNYFDIDEIDLLIELALSVYINVCEKPSEIIEKIHKTKYLKENIRLAYNINTYYYRKRNWTAMETYSRFILDEKNSVKANREYLPYIYCQLGISLYKQEIYKEGIHTFEKGLKMLAFLKNMEGFETMLKQAQEDDLPIKKEF